MTTRTLVVSEALAEVLKRRAQEINEAEGVQEITFVVKFMRGGDRVARVLYSKVEEIPLTAPVPGA